jgi:hypothetical protein
MMVLNRGIRLAIGVLGLCIAVSAGAQENLDVGKSPAQLFASDCAICHKSPQGLAKAGGLFGVQNFLREHYTASRESAGAIAAYLEQVDRAAGPVAKRPAKRSGKDEERPKTGGDKTGADKTAGDKAKAGEKKPDAAKPSEAKSGTAKPAKKKASEPKSPEAKPSEAKPSEAKPSEAKPSEAKPTESKSSEPKSSAPKPSDDKAGEPKSAPAAKQD